MDDEQFKACMETENPTIEEIENIAKEKSKKSEEENKTAHENNQKAEEEERRRMEIAKAAANAKNEDMLENFFRDMQNGTLHHIDVSDMVGDGHDADSETKNDTVEITNENTVVTEKNEASEVSQETPEINDTTEDDTKNKTE